MKRLAAALLTLLAFACLETGSGAATRLTENLAELYRYADAVVAVEVLASAQVPPGKNALPLTVYTLRIQRSYKGPLQAGAEIKAECLGGTDGEFQVVAPGQAKFNPNQHAVVLLNAARGGNWRVTGGDAGQITLDRNHLGEISARRATGQFEFYIKNSHALSGFDAHRSRALDKTTLDELLRALAETGRPVLDERPAPPAAVGGDDFSRAVPAAATAMPDATPMRSIGRLFLAVGLVSGMWLSLRMLKRNSESGTKLEIRNSKS